MPQITLANAVSCTGVSLHSGREVSMEFRPAPENTGIVFHAHTDDGVHVLAPRPEAVSTTELATTISGDGASVSTIEHVLAALSGLCIDNVEVHVHGGEVPILDGSALVVVDALRRAGMCFQRAAKRVFRIVRSLSVEQDGKSIVAEPYDGFHVDYTWTLPHLLLLEKLPAHVRLAF